MSISSMQGRFPFFSLGTSAEYFREKNKFINWTFIYENILVYFSYKMRASPWLICLKYLKYKCTCFGQKGVNLRVVQHDWKRVLPTWLYCTEMKQPQSNYNKVSAAITTPTVTFFRCLGFQWEIKWDSISSSDPEISLNTSD